MESRWGLVVEENRGVQHLIYGAEVLEQITGTREEAMARLEELARSHDVRYPMNSKRTQLLRTAEGFLLITRATELRSYGYRFSLAEVIHDSEDAKLARAAAREAERKQRAADKAAAKEARRAEGRPWWRR